MTESNNVWFVTGASRGLGIRIARAALEAGHQVVATGRDPQRVLDAVGAHDNLHTVALDVTDPDAARAAAESAVERFGRIDVLVNNAGNFYAGYFENISPDQNALGYALMQPLHHDDPRPNNARSIFLDPGARTFFREWAAVADDTVALLRAEAGRDPHDRALSDLIGELSTRSDEFRVRWAAHDVRVHNTGIKKVRHPIVGDLDMPYESLPLDPAAALSLVTYLPEPGSATADALANGEVCYRQFVQCEAAQIVNLSEDDSQGGPPTSANTFGTPTPTYT